LLTLPETINVGWRGPEWPEPSQLLLAALVNVSQAERLPQADATSRGELRQRYREGQEDQLGALGRVLNAVVLWNTRYMDLTLSELRRQGIQVQDEDVARLSPLVFRHINFLGRYAFNRPSPVGCGPCATPATTTARKTRRSPERPLVFSPRCWRRPGPGGGKSMPG
jgi:Tn3 transposase DDE domain-containing protein